MIWTVSAISLMRLWNNKQEFMLAFVVPILFFSIFALIFSRGIGESIAQVRVAFVDDEGSKESRALIRDTCAHPEIKPVTGIGSTSSKWSIAELSRFLISSRNVEVVVYIPAGFTQQNPDAPTLSIELFNEGVNPIGHRLVQASMAEAIALQFAASSIAELRATEPTVKFASATKFASSDSARKQLSSASALPTAQARSTEESNEQTVFKNVSAFASNKHQPKVAMVAAGIAVMFLLFSANGAGASLLEEREAGTLDRLLSSRLTLSDLLIGKWIYITAVGTTQLLVMFVWGQLVFGVDLFGHFTGFLVMAFATSAACASFALFLSAICRSRGQLHAASVVLVLSMSAVGGSMVPRYIMSDTMKSLGKFTFNGWALDGFQKLFWYDLSLSAIRAEVFVLLSVSIGLGLAARVLMKRWIVA